MSDQSSLPPPPTRAKDPSLPQCARVRDIPERTCKACIAASRGLRCFEATVTPCCDRDREECGTCDVFAMCSGDETSTEGVSIELEGGRRIQGSIFVPPSSRLSDLLKSTQPFITVIEVTEEGSDEEIGVLFLNKREISWVRPLAL